MKRSKLEKWYAETIMNGDKMVQINGVQLPYYAPRYGKVLGGKVQYHDHDTTGHVLVTIFHPNGEMREDGTPKIIQYTCQLNLLIARLYVDNPENYTEVRHIDGDKSNCHYSNLEWVPTDKNLIDIDSEESRIMYVCYRAMLRWTPDKIAKTYDIAPSEVRRIIADHKDDFIRKFDSITGKNIKELVRLRTKFMRPLIKYYIIRKFLEIKGKGKRDKLIGLTLMIPDADNKVAKIDMERKVREVREAIEDDKL